MMHMYYFYELVKTALQLAYRGAGYLYSPGCREEVFSAAQRV